MSEESDGKGQSRRGRYLLSEWLDGQEFYEHMQAYRHAGLAAQDMVVATFERVKNLIRQKAREFYEPSVHEDFITVYKSVAGWQTVKMTWVKDDTGTGGMWEPWTTGMGPYATVELAISDGKSWAKEEGMEFYEPKLPTLPKLEE